MKSAGYKLFLYMFIVECIWLTFCRLFEIRIEKFSNVALWTVIISLNIGRSFTVHQNYSFRTNKQMTRIINTYSYLLINKPS